MFGAGLAMIQILSLGDFFENSGAVCPNANHPKWNLPNSTYNVTESEVGAYPVGDTFRTTASPAGVAFTDSLWLS